MAFIEENNQVISFAEYSDVVNRDQRLFDNNEGLTDDWVEPLLIRATERILTKISATAWWRTYWINRSAGTVIHSVADIPAINPTKIIVRKNDFTDLCVYVALGEFILPCIADFSDEKSAEKNKMGYYVNKAESMFMELITAGDWYDWEGNGTVTSSEKDPGIINLKRVR